MFQVEPILWLQSLESPPLTWSMSAISWLGYTPVYATLLIVLIFGLRLKQGLFLFLVIVVCGLLTDGLKRGLMFPRPSDVDRRIIEPGHQRPPLLVDHGGAKNFLALPSSEAMATAKTQTDWSYGLPSGHVALATAFFFGLAFFFRSRGIFAFAVCWVMLMALSRMYLGRHFIGDVLGGMAVGASAIALTVFLVHPLSSENAKGSNPWKLLRWTLFALILIALAPFVELLDKEDIGRLSALLVTYAFLLRVGFPLDKAALWKRTARVLLAILVYILIEQIINPLVDLAAWEDNSFGTLAVVFTITSFSFIGTILLAGRLKLYEIA